MKPILITGSTGYLGQWLMQLAPVTGFTPVGVSRKTEGADWRFPGGLPMKDWPPVLKHLLDQINPAAVIHTAAMSAAAACENEPDQAWIANVNLTAAWALACRATRTPLLFLSTDLVYEGSTGGYQETDIPAPPHVYGRTKLAAEAEILNLTHACWIFRSSLMVGRSISGNTGFTDRMIQTIRSGQPFQAFTDEFRSAIAVDEAARLLLLAIRESIPYGLYNLGGDWRMSRYDLTRQLVLRSGLRADLVEPGSIRNFTGMPARQADVSFSNLRLKSALNLHQIAGVESARV